MKKRKLNSLGLRIDSERQKLAGKIPLGDCIRYGCEQLGYELTHSLRAQCYAVRYAKTYVRADRRGARVWRAYLGSAVTDPEFRRLCGIGGGDE